MRGIDNFEIGCEWVVESEERGVVTTLTLRHKGARLSVCSERCGEERREWPRQGPTRSQNAGRRKKNPPIKNGRSTERVLAPDDGGASSFGAARREHDVSVSVRR